MLVIDKPGIYRGISVTDYHGDPCLEPSFSQSIGKVILDQSAMHAAALHPRMGAVAEIREDAEIERYDKAKAIGDAAHALRIGRGKDMAIGYYDSWRTKEAKTFREVALQLGQTAILDEHYREAKRIVEASSAQLFEHEEKDCFENGTGEVALIWREGPTWFRCLVDWLHDDLRGVDDYKTTQVSVAPHVLGHRAEDGGWHIQMAMIDRGLAVLDPDGIGRRRYRNIAQEQKPPYGLSVMVHNDHWLSMGRKQLDAAIAVWRQSTQTGHWRGYPKFGITPEFPGYKEARWLERETSEFSVENIGAG